MVGLVLRQLRRSPIFFAAACVTVALGVGVNTTAFSIFSRLLLQSLPFSDPGRLVQVWGSRPQNAYIEQGVGDYYDEKAANSVFTDMALYTTGYTATASLTETGAAPLSVGAVRVTGNFFRVIGVNARLGRTFTVEEDKKGIPVAVVSNAFWIQHYQKSPRVLGRTATLNRTTYTIVGVMPPALDDPLLFNTSPGFWVLDTNIPTLRNRHGQGWYTVVARLKPGVSPEAAGADLQVVGARLAHDFAPTNAGYSLRVIPFPTNQVGESGAHITWMLVGLSAMVLVIACVNLANLQLVRTTRRTGEFAVRLALGCPRWRIIRMLVIESILVAVAGGALGLAFARWMNVYVEKFIGLAFPIDWPVFAFTFAVSVLAGLLSGALPAWSAANVEINDSLKAGGRSATTGGSRHWLRQGLVVVEVTLALTLLSGAGYFVTGIYRIAQKPLGWDCPNGLLGSIELDHDHFGEVRDPRSRAFGMKLLSALRALPGIEAACLNMAGTPAWAVSSIEVRRPGHSAPPPGQEIYVGSMTVSPDFLRVYDIPVLLGRNFTDADGPDTEHVILVSETMARQFWPGQNPIGQHLQTPVALSTAWETSEVVGVFRDYTAAAEYWGAARQPAKMLQPWLQNNHRFISFSVRTRMEAAQAKRLITKTVNDLNPNVVVDPSTFKETESSLYSFAYFLRRVMLELAGLGLILSAVGLYGVIANLVAERTKEFGIRLALGAQPRDILWLVLRRGLVLTGIGAAVGCLASMALFRALKSVPPPVPGAEGQTLATVAGLVIAVALLASFLPALRGTRVDPVRALRTE